jgi:hypothetical protein
MAKQKLTEEKMEKFLSLIMGYIIGGKTDKIIPKISNDRDLVNRIKNTDKSYRELMDYMRKEYGEEYVKGVKDRAKEKTKQQLFGK